MAKYLKLMNGVQVSTDVTTSEVTGLDTQLATFSSHIADTSNPHNVTKAQVGLSNVTNDAQLTRGQNDWDTFPTKTGISPSDRILIEDSAASWAKKKISASELISSGGSGVQGILRFQVNGPYNIFPTTTGADGIYILGEDIKIVSVRCYIQLAGNSGSTGFNLLYAPPNTTSFTSILTTVGSISPAAGNWAHIANGESKPNMTAPVLSSTPFIALSGGILRWDITSVQGGNPSGCGLFVYYTK